MPVSKWYSCGTFVSTIVVACYVLAYVLPYWITGTRCIGSNTSASCDTYHIGIWQGCVTKGDQTDECFSVDAVMFDSADVLSAIPTSEAAPELLAARIFGAIGIVSAVVPVVIHALLAVSKRQGRHAVAVKQVKYKLRSAAWLPVAGVMLSGVIVCVLMGRLAGRIHDVGPCLWVMVAGWICTGIEAIFIDRKMVATLLKDSTSPAWGTMNPVLIAASFHPGSVSKGYELAALDPSHAATPVRDGRVNSTASLSPGDMSDRCSVEMMIKVRSPPVAQDGVNPIAVDHRYRAFSNESVRSEDQTDRNSNSPQHVSVDMMPTITTPLKPTPRLASSQASPNVEHHDTAKRSFSNARSRAAGVPGKSGSPATPSPTYADIKHNASFHTAGSTDSELDMDDIILASELNQLDLDKLDVQLSAAPSVDLDTLPLPPANSSTAPSTFVRRLSRMTMNVNQSPSDTASGNSPASGASESRGHNSADDSSGATKSAGFHLRRNTTGMHPSFSMHGRMLPVFEESAATVPGEEALKQAQLSIGRSNSPALLLTRARAPTDAFASPAERGPVGRVKRHTFSLGNLFAKQGGPPKPASTKIGQLGVSPVTPSVDAPSASSGASTYKEALRSLTAVTHEDL